ncbi:hypothetical protein [Xanthomonas arboricola]|uniref:hypothetical protein n=1 Tax=Xanthomonas arboricola TaxID=56448 RepID=UPI000CEF2FD0|nr:hypothetical protein [Xanthomonas arboricola]PPU41869.1 hypothetical protein XaplCFBP3123_01640 [Xanthomonas arboricola pv. populi]
MDEIKKAEQLGYSKGYAAGKKRRAREISSEASAKHQQARFDRFLCAAITGLLGGKGPWQSGGVPDKSPKDYATTAALIARELMSKAP